VTIDTQAKRQAALGFSGPIPNLPFADGAINDDDRYVLLWLYPFAADTGEDVGAASAVRRRRRRPFWW
jgi:hypothetical protein